MGAAGGVGGKIARYKVPEHVFFVTEYPMTGSGKVQKYKLREMALVRLKAVAPRRGNAPLVSATSRGWAAPPSAC